MPNSPPAVPTMTLSLITSGAAVIEYPAAPSATTVFQSGRPLLRVDGNQVGIDGREKQRVAENRQAARDAAAAEPRVG